MGWFLENKEWLFGGAGIFVFSLVIRFFVKKGQANKQIQKSGSNSTNYQAGRDIKIGSSD
ncbi:MAG: hypothetical protein ACUZ8O_12725 [Candidatus Anammoxibacter sp.]